MCWKSDPQTLSFPGNPVGQHVDEVILQIRKPSRAQAASPKENYKLDFKFYASPRRVVFAHISSRFPRYVQFFHGHASIESRDARFTLSEVSPGAVL